MKKHANDAQIPAAQQVHVRDELIVVLLALAMVLTIMNTTMFNLALPAVSQHFGLSPSMTSWIVTGYSVVFAIASITYSRLSDLIQIRRLIVIGLTSLSLSAMVGFFSNSFLLLLLARLVQAAGAGALPALSLVIISRYVPAERRGRATALIMSAVSLSFGLGPVAGGAIVEYFGWQYLFAVPAVTLVLVPLFAKLLPKERPSQGSFDTWGAVLLSVGATGLLLAITNQSWIALVFGLAALTLFAIRIRRAGEPFVQPSLFSNGAYLLLTAVGIGAYMSNFATLFLLPQILINLFDLSAAATGLIIFPGSLLAMIVSRNVGKIIDSKGNRGIISFIPLLILISMILFALFLFTSYFAILFIYIILSIGFTFLTSGISNEITRVLPKSQIGSGLGLFQLLQFFSGAFGVALSASALSWQKGVALSAAYSNLYWGLSVLILLSIACSYLYQKMSVRLTA